GDMRPFADYFRHEVLDGLPAHQVNFLLQSSVLDNLTGEACAAVTGRADAEQLLAAIHQRHVFLNRLESTQPTYRYAPLFQEYLQHTLRVEMPEIARECHCRTAAWLQDRDREAAVHHLIQGAAYDNALECGATLVASRVGDLLLLGQA